MILSVGYHNDGTALFTLGAEAPHRRVDSLAYRCSLHWNRLRRYGIHEHLGRDVIRRYRQLHERISCKDDESYAVVAELVHQT